MNELQEFIIKRVKETFKEMYVNQLEDDPTYTVSCSTYMLDLVNNETMLYVGDGSSKNNIGDEMEVLRLLSLSAIPSLKELIASATNYYGKDNISMFLVLNYMLEMNLIILVRDNPNLFTFIK